MRHFLASSLGLTGPVVLLYHGVTATASESVALRERKYWISGEQFAAQIRQIRDHGFSVRSLSELHNGRDVPQPHKRNVSITFDDGRSSDYASAFPILTEAKAAATFFLNTALVGQPGYLNWPQIAEMQRASMSFQSHSHEHLYLTHLPSSLLDIQLRVSKRILEDRIGQPVDFLAAPYGDVNRRVIEVALAAGYKSVCTSWNWPARASSSSVNRVAVYRSTTLLEFTELLDGNLPCYAKRAARAVLLHIPKRTRLRFLSVPATAARMTREQA
jgi:peptidoglycan/xylan/chitin deacetylase (PgdA/CDA1 family)